MKSKRKQKSHRGQGGQNTPTAAAVSPAPPPATGLRPGQLGAIVVGILALVAVAAYLSNQSAPPNKAASVPSQNPTPSAAQASPALTAPTNVVAKSGANAPGKEA